MWKNPRGARSRIWMETFLILMALALPDTLENHFICTYKSIVFSLNVWGGNQNTASCESFNLCRYSFGNQSMQSEIGKEAEVVWYLMGSCDGGWIAFRSFKYWMHFHSCSILLLSCKSRHHSLLSLSLLISLITFTFAQSSSLHWLRTRNATGHLQMMHEIQINKFE